MYQNVHVEEKVLAPSAMYELCETLPPIPMLRLPEAGDLARGLCPGGRFIHLMPEGMGEAAAVRDLSVPPSVHDLHTRFAEYLLRCTDAGTHLPAAPLQADGFDFVRFLLDVDAESTQAALEVIAGIEAGTYIVPVRVSERVAYMLRCIDVGVRSLYRSDDPVFGAAFFERLPRFSGEDLPADREQLPEYGTGTALLATVTACLAAMEPARRLAHCIVRKHPEGGPRADLTAAALLLGADEPVALVRRLAEMHPERLLSDARLLPLLHTMREVTALRHGHTAPRDLHGTAQALSTAAAALF